MNKEESKITKVETASIPITKKEEAKLNFVIENDVKKVTLNEFHSTEYLKKLKETTFKEDKKVVFILPNGKEVK